MGNVAKNGGFDSKVKSFSMGNLVCVPSRSFHGKSGLLDYWVIDPDTHIHTNLTQKVNGDDVHLRRRVKLWCIQVTCRQDLPAARVKFIEDGAEFWASASCEWNLLGVQLGWVFWGLDLRKVGIETIPPNFLWNENSIT